MMIIDVKSKKHGLKQFFIDENDFDKIKDYNFGISNNGFNKEYVYCFKKKDSKNKIYLHRIITDCPSGLVVDHINGNTFDNRQSNLRICTIVENSINCPVSKNKIHSKYKGVFYRKDKNNWRVDIRKDGKRHHFGTFYNEVDAAICYNKNAVILFGEYAQLNIIDGD